MTKGMRWIAAAAVAGAMSCTLAPAAQAEELDVDAGVVMSSPTKDPGFNLAGPGRLTVRAYDIGVSNTVAPPLQALSFSVYNSGSIFMHAGSGEMTIDVSGPGMFFLNLSMSPSAQSRFQLGLVSWAATFAPNAPVPLPASVWLLIAGLAWATGLQRSRAKLARNQSVTYVT